METFKQVRTILIVTVFGFINYLSSAQAYETATVKKKPDFQWPEGKYMGVSLTFLETPDAIWQYEADPVNDIWIDNGHSIASYVREKRGESLSAEIPAYKNPLLPVELRINDLLSRMTLEEKVGQMNIPTCYSTEIGWGLGSKSPPLWEDPSKEARDRQLEGCRKWTEGTQSH